MTPALRLDLKNCLNGFAAPLLEVFLKTAQLISANATARSHDVLCPFFASQRPCCEIFHSLNSFELLEFSKDHMWEWMTEFRSYLTTTYLLAIETGGTVDALRATICENLQRYMEKYKEEFRDYIKGFASAVWNLLTASAATTSCDYLTIIAIKFCDHCQHQCSPFPPREP